MFCERRFPSNKDGRLVYKKPWSYRKTELANNELGAVKEQRIFVLEMRYGPQAQWCVSWDFKQ